MSNEKELFSCKTGIALGNDFFAQQQSATKFDIAPVAEELVRQSNIEITTPGIYELKIILTRLK